jgi:hypothetical protein
MSDVKVDFGDPQAGVLLCDAELVIGCGFDDKTGRVTLEVTRFAPGLACHALCRDFEVEAGKAYVAGVEPENNLVQEIDE